MNHLLFCLALVGVACQPAAPPPARIFSPADADSIRAVMDRQEKAWDRGDLDDFMAGYSDSTCFIGRKGLTCGKKEVTASYKEAYPDTAMGDLTFGITELKAAGADHAWLTGTWRLRFPHDTLGGGFSLLWQREGSHWRILRDHSY